MDNTPINLQQFNEGAFFFFTGESGRYRLEYPSGSTRGCLCRKEPLVDYTEYACSVEKIDNRGFTVYGTHLGKSFRRRILFSSCFLPNAVKPQRNLNDSSSVAQIK